MNVINSSFQNQNASNASWMYYHNSTVKEISDAASVQNGKEVKFISLCIIILAALLGNGFILWHISKDRRRRSATNIYIASQCVTDFATSLLVIPFGAASLLQGGWMLGKGFAIANCFFNMFFTSLMLLNLAVIALDRYFAVVKRSHHLITQRTAMWIVLGCCATAFVVSFPWLPLLSDEVAVDFMEGFLTCGQKFVRSSAQLEIGLFFIISAAITCIPMAIICFSFYHIAKKVKKSRCSTNPMALSNARKLQADAYAKSAKTSFIVTLSSLIQVFPACMMMALDGIQFMRIPKNVATAAKIIMWSHCALKPIVYAVRKRMSTFSGEDKRRDYLESHYEQKSLPSISQRSNVYIADGFQTNFSCVMERRQVNNGNKIIYDPPCVVHSFNTTKEDIDRKFDNVLAIVNI